MRREGHRDNVKRVYRLYREEGLSQRLKRPRRNKVAKLCQPKQLAWAINEIWSREFLLLNGTETGPGVRQPALPEVMMPGMRSCARRCRASRARSDWRRSGVLYW